MDEKKYEIIGKVEIGTDEYRDLIERSLKAENEAGEYRSKFWYEQDEAKKYKNALEVLKEKNAMLIKFITEKNLLDEYNQYALAKKLEDEASDEPWEV